MICQTLAVLGSFHHCRHFASGGWRGCGAQATWVSEGGWWIWWRFRTRRKCKAGQHSPEGWVQTTLFWSCSKPKLAYLKIESIFNQFWKYHLGINLIWYYLMQEYEKFIRFCDSLLSRAGKLSELSQSLEQGLEESGKSETSFEGKKVKQYQS